MKSILGISAFYHDSAAALIVDGRIVAAAEEERFSPQEGIPIFPPSGRLLPERSRDKARGVDYVAFYEKPLLKFDRLLETYFAFAPPVSQFPPWRCRCG